MAVLRTYYGAKSRITATRLESGGITLSVPPDQDGSPGFAVLIPTGEFVRLVAGMATADRDEALDILCRLFGGTSMEAE